MSLSERLWQERDLASAAVLRIFVGLVMCVSTLRFLLNGWVEKFFEKPTFFFAYWGFEVVSVASPQTLTLIHIVMALAALGVALGFYYRISAAVFFVLFTYVELLDVTNYLNHYVLVSFLALLFCFLPLHGKYSLDAWRKPQIRRDLVPAWMLYLLRVQIGVVYFYAGLAKLHPDWLVHGQPLGIWLAARTEVPLIGALLSLPGAALVFSWAGFLHDLLIVPALLWRRTRVAAYAVLLAFHLGTHLLFTIGIFPILMPLCATIFFDADWPRAVARRLKLPWKSASTYQHRKITEMRRGLVRLGFPAALLWCAFQVLMPLRAHLYPGDVLWTEQGMRFSWRVMLREKNGSIDYRVKSDRWPREKRVSPNRYLTSRQEREMSGQPDLIVRLGQHIGRELEAQGHRGVQVRVDAMVSLNGRPAAHIIDPTVDLMHVTDGLGSASWLEPMPKDKPLGSTRAAVAVLKGSL